MDATLRRRLAAGETAVGLLTALTSLQLADMMALAGYDFVMFDLEHGPIQEETLEALCRVARLRGVAPLCRVRDQHPKSILRALDAGALGVMVPGVDDAAAAREVARACRYAPAGTRGMFGASAAADWGALPLPDYLRAANEAVVCIVQVESAAAVADAAAIAATPGVDGVVIGPGDLSQSLGHPGELDHPEVRAAVDRAVAAVRAAGRWVGTIATPESAAALHARGVRLFLVGATAVLTAALRGHADAMRRALAGGRR